MKFFLLCLLVLSSVVLVGCGDGKLIDARGQKGDSIIGQQGLTGLEGSQGSVGIAGAVGPQGIPGRDGTNAELYFICHLPNGKKEKQHSMFAPASALPALLAASDYYGECK